MKGTLALFFTKGMSLQRWEELGMLEREILPYKAFAKHFERIYFFTYGDEKDLRYRELLGDTITILPQKVRVSGKLYSLLLPFFYLQEVRSSNILKTNQMSGSWAAVLAKWLSGAKLVVRCGYEWLEVMERRNYAWWKLKLAAFLEHVSYKAANAVIFSNEADKEYARKRFGLNPAKLFIIPNFVDTERFKPLPLEKEKGRIIFIGKLEDQKNLFELIEAVSPLQVRLTIIGSGSLRQQLEKFTKEKGAQVEFWGNIPNSRLPEELNKSELFILPSLYEGHPKALLEAMSCGLPCIGANVKGIDTVIKHKENGYLCEPQAESIRAAIKAVLQDKELQMSMGRAARQRIQERFTLNKVVASELSLYQQLLS